MLFTDLTSVPALELAMPAENNVVDITDQLPQRITPDRMTTADIVITLGRDIKLDDIPSSGFENWNTDEPSERGIDGMQRMRMVRDDIGSRVSALAQQLTAKD